MESSNKTWDIINPKFYVIIFILISKGAFCQAPSPIYNLTLLGTRSWIRVEWESHFHTGKGFNIYWSTKNIKPEKPSVTLGADKRLYYIQPIIPEAQYHVWVESFDKRGNRKAVSGKVFTTTKWSLDTSGISRICPLSSQSVPQGMQLYWHDEFNDMFLNRNKWFTDYYSTIDFLHKVNYQALFHDSLPLAAYTLNGRYIDLFENDSLPERAFDNGKKISSIQTYDWATNENLLDDSRGGYFEVRVRRGSTGKVQGLNTAFWLDSPGPDLKYYLPEGAVVNGTMGIRPNGQLFEIDMFENLDAQFVMHGRVAPDGRFIHNLATDVDSGYKPGKYIPGGEWVTFGLLWTPTSITHYRDGKLIKAYDNKHQIYSPNHVMNILLGSYGKGGTVNLQVDYIRYYRWPISKNNELPNPGFEADTTLLPWDGTGRLSTTARRSGRFGVLLQPGQFIEQYVYLNNDVNYQLKYWTRGISKLDVKVNNIKQVSGRFENTAQALFKGKSGFAQGSLHFTTKKLYNSEISTVRIIFYNTGNSTISLDDITVSKIKEE